MNIILAIVLGLLFLGLIAFAAIMVMKQINKTDPSNSDTSTDDDITTAQEFLPFESIRDGVIHLGGHDYRAIIECSSTNYNLKTEGEREMIEVSFQRFLNSLTFPITFFIQTRVIDNTKIMEQLEKDLKLAIKTYPHMDEYANVYFQEMGQLQHHMQNNKQKKKYIIVPYNEAINLSKLSDKEKYLHSTTELHQRALMLIESLTTIGVKGHLLDTRGLTELVYSTYHKDNYSNYEHIVSGEQLALIVQGERNPEQEMSNDQRVDWILYEAQMRVRNEITGKPLAPTLKKEYEKVVKDLDILRDKHGGYFKNR